MSESIKIDIWSDIACPWCYIGKRKFEAGAAAFAEKAGADAPDVTIEYHSFELAPDTPVDFDGDEIDFLSTHKGMPADQVKGMLEHVTGIAEAAGLDYNFDVLKHTNTIKAHQLLHYAKAHGKQLEAKERLLKAYFTEGRHVGRIDDLADLAAEIGLDRDDVVRSLTEGEFLSDVRADQALGREYGIQGVPFFVIDGKYGVSGAQEAATFAQVLDQVWAQREEGATV
ncbi:DsbA family oxidoreductase [Mycetocola zhadangensis]|uniref:DsbA family oxidoreductase n=1 Tax=Mycetocola zhadangensis TaxID=1164595 RepID=A0A3L7J974_9MICO|nr:DsbA family oxidoreductase [Mycetocola zhadangensis]RLQ86011.1 DsbA family oxidoreductase [Mycetocola zhadangensis]GGE87599.1 DSBA oxidoreductase [Mycetocola zhadangensis]